ncbi:hypothetical protein [Streptosporangium saharense]|uniref:hypothetical protein n=1 Tax=Streptosporangium saharense TaxID=1706840 RepID=UPI0033215927
MRAPAIGDRRVPTWDKAASATLKPVGDPAPGRFFTAGAAGVIDRMATPREVYGRVVQLSSDNDPDAPHDIVDRANTSEYGPAARVAALVRFPRTATGAVLVNMIHVPEATTGGQVRGMGPYAIVAYTETNGVWTHLGGS